MNESIPPIDAETDNSDPNSLLTVYHLPFTPDLHETFLSLCDMLIAAYRQVYNYNNLRDATAETWEAIQAVDELVKRDFIDTTVRDMDMLSKSLVYEETKRLDGLLINSK